MASRQELSERWENMNKNDFLNEIYQAEKAEEPAKAGSGKALNPILTVVTLVVFIGGMIFAVLVHSKQPQLSVMAVGVIFLYMGIMSCGVSYTLQIIGQKGLEPSIAALLMSLESVFAALSGWVILGEKMSGKEMAGCAIIFGAVILAQLRLNKRDKVKKGLHSDIE